MFQLLNMAVLPSGPRPLLCFCGDQKIEKDWFTNSGDKRQIVRAKDMAWATSHIHDVDKLVLSFPYNNGTDAAHFLGTSR